MTANKTSCKLSSTFEAIIDGVKSASTVALATSGAFLIAGADPALIWGLMHIMQMFFYLIFMNVDYPEHVEAFLRVFKIATLDFLPNPFVDKDDNP